MRKKTICAMMTGFLAIQGIEVHAETQQTIGEAASAVESVELEAEIIENSDVTDADGKAGPEELLPDEKSEEEPPIEEKPEQEPEPPEEKTDPAETGKKETEGEEKMLPPTVIPDPEKEPAERWEEEEEEISEDSESGKPEELPEAGDMGSGESESEEGCEETDTKEIPPCMILKSDGASLYNTTDLATIVQRMEDFHPDEIIYVVDKRQELHFVQVFRCAKKANMVDEDTKLSFVGFGTMNGKDGKPFKTREGGVMRLERLIAEINEEMYKKIVENRSVKDENAEHTAQLVGLSAIKYGDLSNQASKDYVFDIDRFTSFEGNTGPYILYTIVRIKSILNKYTDSGKTLENLSINPADSATEKALMLSLAKFSEIMAAVYTEKAPHKLCQFIYEVSNAFNGFYHDTKILAETDEAKQKGYIALICLTKAVLKQCIELLAIECPDRM